MPRLQGVRALLVLTGVKWALVPPEGSVPQSDKMSAPHPQGAETGRVPAGRRGQGKCLGEKLPLDGVRRQGMPGSQDWCAQRGMGERVPRASLPPAPPPMTGIHSLSSCGAAQRQGQGHLQCPCPRNQSGDRLGGTQRCGSQPAPGLGLLLPGCVTSGACPHTSLSLGFPIQRGCSEDGMAGGRYTAHRQGLGFTVRTPGPREGNGASEGIKQHCPRALLH